MVPEGQNQITGSISEAEQFNTIPYLSLSFSRTLNFYLVPWKEQRATSSSSSPNDEMVVALIIYRSDLLIAYYILCPMDSPAFLEKKNFPYYFPSWVGCTI